MIRSQKAMAAANSDLYYPDAAAVAMPLTWPIMQLCILWEDIMQRFRDVEIVDDVQRLPNNFIRGIKVVPVRLHRLQ